MEKETMKKSKHKILSESRESGTEVHMRAHTDTSTVEKHHKHPFGIWILVLAILLALSLVANIILLTSTKNIINPSVPAGPVVGAGNGTTAPTTAGAKTAQVSLTIIAASTCANCATPDKMVTALQGISGIKISDQKTFSDDSADAKALIAKYAIKKLPVLILTGDVQGAKSLATSFNPSQDGSALIQETTQPPYLTDTGEIKGVITATIINDTTCVNCVDLNTFIAQLRQGGYVFGTIVQFSSADASAQSLIAKYNITRLPSMLFSNDAKEYPDLQAGWVQIGGIVSADGIYVYQTQQPPYRDLATGTIRGSVTLIYLIDASCTTCYNVSLHKQVLSNFGVTKLDSEKTYDVASPEGKALITKYNITLVPTVILQGDVSAYKSLAGVWAPVGSVESDGSYIFRKPDVMNGPYRDLSSGKIITPAAPTASAGTAPTPTN